MKFEYSERMAEAIAAVLEMDGWDAEPVDEIGRIRFSVELDCKIREAECEFRVLDNSFLLLTGYWGITADQESHRDVIEFLSRANHNMYYGSFELNAESEQIRFRISHYCGEKHPQLTAEQIRHAIRISLATVERYGDGLLSVIMGYENPKAAIEQAEAS